ncbi:TIGR04063 family PEP-CTERM/XrtA system glycosyltransferase [Nitrospira moscoviensis]|uniref:TIGR04063 family PEP-CTERM/XrtA system glycosyltransferase n=1 Tax=Nitrospira moscoviensis TaxID=42253 RepID=UPI0006A7EB4D|nr:TIGR04063 family PEP-CTERM/XrtA system glycosyltransferase [Nitrospira moscoviensis]
MRVLHVLDHSLPVQSGYAFRSEAVCIAQKRRGWEPIVVTSPKHYESWRGEWNQSEEIGGIRYYRARTVSSPALPLLGEVRLMAALARRLSSVIHAESPHVLHPHSPVLNAIPALLMGRRWGIPVIYEMRSSWEDAAVDRGSYAATSWKYKVSRSLETWVCSKADRVVVICEGLKRDLVGRGIPQERIVVVPNGVDVERFQPRPGDADVWKRLGLQGKKVVSFMGSFFRWEGLDLLIDAVAKLARVRSDVALLLVGGGEMEAALKDKIRLLGIEQHVVMPGWIPQADTLGLYPLIDVLAFPRYSTHLTERVTPLKPLEAMAMGKAVIASDVGGHRELVRHQETGLLFEAGNAAALAEALAAVFDSTQLRTRLEHNGLNWVARERSWAKTTESYREAYRLGVSRAIVKQFEVKEERS